MAAAPAGAPTVRVICMIPRRGNGREMMAKRNSKKDKHRATRSDKKGTRPSFYEIMKREKLKPVNEAKP
jgi:hypothetical protein